MQDLKKLETCEEAAELHNSYRLLSPSSMFLIASHYEERGPESLISLIKWESFKVFDKSLKNSENLPKAQKAIQKTIVDLSNIAILRRLFAILMDETINAQEKTDAYLQIDKTNSSLFAQIKHCLSVAKKENSETTPDTNESDVQLKQTVITQMIWGIKQGLINCNHYDFLFKKEETLVHEGLETI